MHTRSSLAGVELSLATTASRSAGLLIAAGRFTVPLAATRMVTWRVQKSSKKKLSDHDNSVRHPCLDRKEKGKLQFVRIMEPTCDRPYLELNTG